MKLDIDSRHLYRFMVAFLLIGAIQAFAGIASLPFAQFMTTMQSNVQYASFAGGTAILTATFVQAMRHHDSMGAIGHTAVGGGVVAGLAMTTPLLMNAIPGVQAAII